MQRRTAEPTARCCSAPTAVGRRCTRTKKGTVPERSAHRGSCGASLQTPRAGRRRFGGLAVGSAAFAIRCRARLIRAGPVRGRVALVPRGAKVRGSLATSASRAPSDSSGATRKRWEGRRPPAPVAKNPGQRSVGYFLRPPLPGGGTPAGAKRRRGGVGPCRKLDLAKRRAPPGLPPIKSGGRPPSPCRGG